MFITLFISVILVIVSLILTIINLTVLNSVSKGLTVKWIFLSRALADLDYQVQELRKEVVTRKILDWKVAELKDLIKEEKEK